jgi:hypothetical protein
MSDFAEGQQNILKQNYWHSIFSGDEPEPLLTSLRSVSFRVQNP